MRIGICERGWARPAISSHQLIEELRTMAVDVERLGFDKLWLTEHHLADYAWALPDLLVPMIAGVTRTLTVGIGGVLVASRNPYRTALDLSLLHAMLGDRIEIGIGRAPAAGNHRCLSGDDESADSKEVAARYLTRLATLLACLGFPVSRTAYTSECHGEFRLLPPLAGHHLPAPWLLGSSVASMTVAAQWGLPFGCIDVPGAPAIVKQYREKFRPSPWLSQPRVLVSIIGASGDDAAHALLSVDAAKLEGGVQAADLLFLRRDAATRFTAVSERYAPDEIVYTDSSADPRHRLSTYEAIAEQWPGHRRRWQNGLTCSATRP